MIIINNFQNKNFSYLLTSITLIIYLIVFGQKFIHNVLAQCFWDAGVPQEVLQLVPCSGSRGGRKLVEDPRVDAVILTGGTATARHMLTDRPGLPLFAETGGKNATIVTALSDRDLAIKHVLHSAFSHGGQKSSLPNPNFPTDR